ncbi:MAG: hypothetical protein M1812_002267 [Candelaria pacifica]|nr:MAG: hypothetical protein M1812_002267 [Candelaria pacifica]
MFAASFLAGTVLSAAVAESLHTRAVPEPKCSEEFGFPVLQACMHAYRDNMVVRNGDNTISRLFRVSTTPLTNDDVWTPQEYQHFKIRNCVIQVFNSPVLVQPERSTFTPLQEAVRKIIAQCVARQGTGGYIGGLGELATSKEFSKRSTNPSTPGDDQNLAVFVGWFNEQDVNEWGPPSNAVTNPSYEDPKHDDVCEGGAGRKDVTGKLNQEAGSSVSSWGAGGEAGPTGWTYGTMKSQTPISISRCPGFQVPAQCMALEVPKLVGLDALMQSPQSTDIDSELDPQMGYCRDNSACCSGYQCVQQAVQSVAVLFGLGGVENFAAGICQIAQGTLTQIGVSGRSLGSIRRGLGF